MMTYHRLNTFIADYQALNKDLSHHHLGKHYDIFEKIGKGAYGQVYRVVHKTSKETAALKVLNLHDIEKEKSSTLKQLRKKYAKWEDIFMAICDSPNVVKVREVFANKDLKFIFMEYCNKGSLKQEIKRRGRIPEREAVPIIKQVIKGLAHLHSMHIMHRDLKSDNILLHNSEVKLADLGLSKYLLINEEDQVQKNTILGTPTTMAPEVLAKQPYGLKADIWSIGVIFYEMLFGELPFTGIGKDHLLQNIKENELLKKGYLEVRGISISQEAFSFLEETLQVDPSKRIMWMDLLRHPLATKEGDITSIEDPGIFDEKGDPLDIKQIISNKKKALLDRQSSDGLPDTIAQVPLMRLPQPRKTDAGPSQSDKDVIYQQMQQHMHKFMKVELVFREIIEPIQMLSIFDPGEREVIEMMSLLVSRCYNDLQQLNTAVIHRKRRYNPEDLDPSVKQTKTRIKKLYAYLQQVWSVYNINMLQEEDKVINKIRDFFTSSLTVEEREKYLRGIPDVDYTRREHVRYTQLYFIDPLLNQHSISRYPRLRMLLKQYSTIMLSCPQDYKNGDFDAFVEHLIWG